MKKQLVFDTLITAIKLETKNKFYCVNNEIYIKLADNSVARIILKKVA